MQNNTDAFSWRRSKDKSPKWKKKDLLQASQPSFFFFFNFFYSKDDLKSQFIALSDDIE